MIQTKSGGEEKGTIPYASPLPALPEGSNAGFKKSETRNL